MSTLKVDGIRSNSASSDAITLASDGTCTANITNNLSNKNLIINGEMKVCQRSGTTSTAVTNVSKYVLDRFMVSTVSGGGTSLNVQQLHGNPTSAPYGFAASMKATVAVTDDGGSDSFNVVQTRIENLDSNYLAFGTSQAKTVTVSFHVKSSLTGTFGGALVSGDFSKGYVFQYTISSANTWEKKTITIPGDTASTADSVYNRGSATSLRGLVLYFDLGSGSNAEKSSANSWSATGTWGYGARIAGNVKLCATSGADWSITGVQLEVGSVATDFEHRSYGQELALCQRYYQLLVPRDSGENPIGIFYTDTSVMYCLVALKATMRATPTLDVSNYSNAFRAYGQSGVMHNTVSLNTGCKDTILLQASGNSGTAGYLRLYADGSDGQKAKIAVAAEL